MIVSVTPAARDALARRSSGPCDGPEWNTRKEDGDYLIDMPEETVTRLISHRLRHETVSDVLVRALAALERPS